MTDDPAAIVAERLKALDNAVLINVLTKAKNGESISASDWREARRVARCAGLVGDLPQHASDADLAAALGVTTRTLTAWRRAGAPLGASGGDELLVRLWHLAHGAGRRGKGRGLGELAAPGDTLAPYLAQIAGMAQATATRGDGARERLQAQLARKAELHNAKAERALVAQAQRAFARYVALLRERLDRALLGDRLADLWEAAQGPRAQAEPRLLALLRERIDRAEADALAALAQPEERT